MTILIINIVNFTGLYIGIILVQVISIFIAAFLLSIIVMIIVGYEDIGIVIEMWVCLFYHYGCLYCYCNYCDLLCCSNSNYLVVYVIYIVVIIFIIGYV